MGWQARRRVSRLVACLSAGVALGVAPGALYAGLVGTVHLAVYRHWDRVPTFAVGCVLAGAAVGLLGGVLSALWGDAAPASAPDAPTISVKPQRLVLQRERNGTGRPSTPGRRFIGVYHATKGGLYP
jgi:hypothetical protein